MAQTKQSNGFTFTAHVGDRAVLLAFDLDESKLDHLAGFAVQVTPPGGKASWLLNTLGFAPVTAASTAATGQKPYFPTVDAPYQMFHWVHFPPDGPGNYTYKAIARYFADDQGTTLNDPAKDPSVELSVTVPQATNSVSVGMTRGYVSSQAYINHFGGNPPDLTPAPWTPNAKVSADLEKKYSYLGAHGRELVYGFLDDVKKSGADLDVFAYDFNETEIIPAIAAIAAHAKVRIFQDNSKTHIGDTAKEPKAADFLTHAGAQVKFGHFLRFAHDKIFIKREKGTATRVLTGSANFSVRGLYVQANSVLVFETPTKVPPLYAKVFDEVWNDDGSTSAFKKSASSTQWQAMTIGSSKYRFSFAPHTQPYPLDDVGKSIGSATSSVLFAIMETSGGGPVMQGLKKIVDSPSILTLGTIEQKGQLQAFRGDDATAGVVSFGYLNQEAPKPFHVEVDAGQGQHIHHKFVVCDFNGANPVAYAGSSNLSSGGESQNGDNLIEIRDPAIVTAYAVEAIRLFDHYRFRARQEKSTGAGLALVRSNEWTRDFYDPHNLKCTERLRLANAGVALKAPGPKLPLKKGAKAKAPAPAAKAKAKAPAAKAKRRPAAPPRPRR